MMMMKTFELFLDSVWHICGSSLALIMALWVWVTLVELKLWTIDNVIAENGAGEAWEDSSKGNNSLQL